MKNKIRNEKGSLALEQVLFIGAVVTMSLGLFAFYDNISTYFKNFSISNLPTTVATTSQTSSN
ncbi:MAG: hypothetical protein KBC84_05945 [Proteobacteria bacterium]|nr:hypothetical protein [Pseudomonadota bacterium]